MILDGGDSINRGLVGFWPLNTGAGNVAFDGSLKRRNGAFVNITQTSGSGWATGKYGKTLAVDGTNDYVSVPHAADFSIGTTGFLSIGIRVFNTATGGGWRAAITKNVATAGFSIYGIWRSSGGQWHFRSGTNSFNSAATATVGAWSYLCFTIKKAGTFTGYVDGVSVGTATDNSTDATNPLIIASAYPTLENLPGAIQDVRVYNRLLLPSEILRLSREPWAGTLQPSARTRFVRISAGNTDYSVDASPLAYNYQAADVDITRSWAIDPAPLTYTYGASPVSINYSPAGGGFPPQAVWI